GRRGHGDGPRAPAAAGGSLSATPRTVRRRCVVLEVLASADVPLGSVVLPSRSPSSEPLQQASSLLSHSESSSGIATARSLHRSTTFGGRVINASFDSAGEHASHEPDGGTGGTYLPGG